MNKDFVLEIDNLENAAEEAAGRTTAVLEALAEVL